MTEALAKVFEFFKLKLPTLIAVTIALSAFLFLPEDTAKQLGIEKLRADYRSYAGSLLLLSSALTLVQLIIKLWTGFSQWRNIRSLRKEAFECLHSLSPQEKQILVGYIVGNQKTQYFSPMDGVVNGLCAAGILFRASSMGNLFGRGFAFNIQPWAWDYLHEHPELVTEGAPRNSEGYLIQYRNQDNLFDM